MIKQARNYSIHQVHGELADYNYIKRISRERYQVQSHTLECNEITIITISRTPVHVMKKMLSVHDIFEA